MPLELRSNLFGEIRALSEPINDDNQGQSYLIQGLGLIMIFVFSLLWILELEVLQQLGC